MRTIELRAVWCGIESNMQVIPIGIYNEDDPALCGLAQYLIENGHARVIEDTLPVVEASLAAPEIEILEETTFEPLAESDESNVETEDLEIGVDLAEGEDFTAETVVSITDEPAEDEPETPRKRNKK